MKHAVRKSIAALVAGKPLVVPGRKMGAEPPASGLHALPEAPAFVAGQVYRANVFLNGSGSAQPGNTVWGNQDLDSGPDNPRGTRIPLNHVDGAVRVVESIHLPGRSNGWDPSGVRPIDAHAAGAGFHPARRAVLAEFEASAEEKSNV